MAKQDTTSPWICIQRKGVDSLQPWNKRRSLLDSNTGDSETSLKTKDDAEEL